MKKNRIHMTRTFRTCLVLPMTVFLWLSATSANAQTNDQSSARMGSGAMMMQGGTQGKMMDQCKAMMEKRQKLQAKIEQQDAELESLVTEMNKAPENRKLDLLATVVSKLVNDRKATHEEMLDMQTRMMQHVMQHVQAGKESMTNCPMMKGMMGK